MLAIIIPFYKLTFFRETLESLAAQNDQRFHVYIGNDASPENPENLLKEFEGKFKFTYKKFAENLGGASLPKQWERCIEMMQGEEWFMILGDDDYLHADSIKGFHQTISMQSGDLKVLRYNVQVIRDKDNTISEEIIYVDGEKSTTFIEKRSQGLVRSSLSEYVFKTTAYHRYGINSYPKAFYSDNMMVLRYSDFGPIKNIVGGKVFIRVSELSLSGDSRNLKYLTDAGYIFYNDLFTKYHRKFTTSQMKLFLPYAFDGYILKITDVKFLTIFRMIYKNSTPGKTFNLLVQLVKNRLYILLKN